MYNYNYGVGCFLDYLFLFLERIKKEEQVKKKKVILLYFSSSSTCY